MVQTLSARLQSGGHGCVESNKTQSQEHFWLGKPQKTATTDATGRLSAYKYEPILDVNVNKTSGNDTYSGSGVIRLLREKQNKLL